MLNITVNLLITYIVIIKFKSIRILFSEHHRIFLYFKFKAGYEHFKILNCLCILICS